jgi:hypothetical protein
MNNKDGKNPWVDPNLCRHVFVSNSGRGGKPDFRVNRQMSHKPLMHVMCGRCGCRTWVSEDDWKNMIIKKGNN